MSCRILLFLSALFFPTCTIASEWQLIAETHSRGYALEPAGVCVYEKIDPTTKKSSFSCSFFAPSKAQAYERVQELSGPKLYATNGFASVMFSRAIQAFRILHTASTAHLYAALQAEEKKITYYKDLLGQQHHRSGKFPQHVYDKILEIEQQGKQRNSSVCPNPFLAVFLTEFIGLKNKNENSSLPEPEFPFLNAFMNAQKKLTETASSAEEK